MRKDHTDSNVAKISCQNLWKIFGSNADNFLKEYSSPTPENFKSTGHIGAVQDVSCDIYDGEILIIMGLSGSGKSTLLRGITRLAKPTSGKVIFDGIDLATASEKELIRLRRHKMGMVFQNFGLLPHRTVLDNVAFPLEIQKIPKNKRIARAEEMISLVGLEGRENYFPRELSGGQQQRVGIARSLAVEPDVWFLDEPFSALDPLIRHDMQDEFIRLQTMLNKTIFFITHDFDEAVRLADRIGIMKDGKLIQLTTPEDMVQNPADDYVAEFTKNAPISRILSVKSIMQPLTNGIPENRSTLSCDKKVNDVAADILSSETEFIVTDNTQKPIGVVNKKDVINALFGNE